MLLVRRDNANAHQNDNESATESREWDVLSTSLYHHGLTPISFISCKEMSGKNLKNYVATSCENSENLRKYISVLIKDKNARKDMIQDMAITNTKLREELKMYLELTKVQQQTLIDIKGNISNLHLASTQNKESEASTYFKKCQLLEVEVEILNKKIDNLMEEDEKQRLKSDKAFEDLIKRLGRGRVDDSVLMIIDGYERKLFKLTTPQDGYKTAAESPSPNFKLLMKSYENKLDACNKKIKQHEVTNKLLRSQLEARANGHNKVSSVPQKISSSNKFDRCSSTERSSRALDLKNKLSLHQRPTERSHKELHFSDEEDGQLKFAAFKQSSRQYELENFNGDIARLINSKNYLRKPCEHLRNQSVCLDNECMLSSINDWMSQMKQLKTLRESLKYLSEKLFPWQQVQPKNGTCSVPELIEMVEQMADRGSCKKSCKHENLEGVDKEQLIRIVMQFQKLFEVPNVSGVLYRMSQLYVKLNENFNLMVNIKQLLGLGKTASSKAVINKISTLASLHKDASPRTLGVEEFDSLMDGLEDNQQYCSILHETLQNVMKLTGADSIAQVLPRIKRLVSKV